jgi:hypothetical protein
MKKHRRSQFFGVPTVTTGDVLNFSVRFPIIAEKNPFVKRTAEEFEEIYLEACKKIPRLREFEEIVHRKLGNDASPAGTDWYRRSQKEKVALATLLVCTHILRDSNIHVHTYSFQLFKNFDQHGSFTIFPARKIPFLIIMQLALLQHVFVPGRYEGFQAVLESYAGKSRTNVKIDIPDMKNLEDSKWKQEKAAEMAKKMIKQYETSSAAAIWRFNDFLGKNNFVSNGNNRRNNRLIVGIGFSFEAGAGNYPVIPPPARNNPDELVPSFSMPDQGEDADDTEDPKRKEDAGDTSNCERCAINRSEEKKKTQTTVRAADNDLKNNESGQSRENNSAVPDISGVKVGGTDDACEQSAYGEDEETEGHNEIDWKTGSTLFFVGGRTFPKRMLPSTHYEKNVRLQQYSVSFRFSEELKDPYSWVVGTPYINGNERENSFNFGNYLLQHTKFNQYVRNNMKILRDEGNIARLERTEDNSTEENTEIEALLTNGIIHSMDRIEQHLQCFKVGPATIVAEFFANALLARVRILQEFMNSHFAQDTDGDYYPLIHLINEVASHCRNFYSGRGSLYEEYVVGKNLSMQHQRPILSLLPGYLNDFIERKTAKRFDEFWETFQRAAKFMNPLVYDEARTADLQYPSRVMACSRCFRLFSSLYQYRKLSNEFDQHPCFRCSCCL